MYKRQYLDWHTGILLETDGKMGIYRKESGKLIYKEKADSEDGYLGMYLFLMGKYPLYTGEADVYKRQVLRTAYMRLNTWNM